MTIKNQTRGQVGVLIVLLVLFIGGILIFAIAYSNSSPKISQNTTKQFSGQKQQPLTIDSIIIDPVPSFFDAYTCIYEGSKTDDIDKDGIVDACDNCMYVYNPEQSDKNGNNVGDQCDSSDSVKRRSSNGGGGSSGGSIKCTTNSSCGTDGFTGIKTCSGNDSIQTYITYSCSNPGSTSSSCSNTQELRTVETCLHGCQEGLCINQTHPIACTFDYDCNDNNTHTQDNCINSGSEQSYCTHTPITCLSDAECGASGPFGPLFCTNKALEQLHLMFTCNNPGTILSSCSQTNMTHTVQNCTDYCLNGSCKTYTCKTNADCSDNNTQTNDTCVNPGTPQSTCTHTPIGECLAGQTRICGVSDVGQCQFGTQTCGTNLQWGSCLGQQDPITEVCDGIDNNCNGVTDETFPALGQSCSVGVGQCARTGIGVCSGNALSTQCSATAGLPGTEVCDGIDNDCDGQTDEGGVCAPVCTNQCASGARQCNGNGFQVCADYNNDGCSEWSNTTNCGTSKSCNAGECVALPPTCTNQCTLGSNQCNGNGVQTCGFFNADSCTEWGPITSCLLGQTCSSGNCVALPPTCTNQCASGSKQCSGSGVQTCADYNSDGCSEWGSALSCGTGQTCQSGNCVALPPTCTSTCTNGARECILNGFRVCRDYNNDGCYEWSQPTNCGFGKSCTAGVCA